MGKTFKHLYLYKEWGKHLDTYIQRIGKTFKHLCLHK